MLDAAFVFPTIKGFQARREYFTSMVPLGIIVCPTIVNIWVRNKIIQRAY